jgi:hypothetical protein
VHAIDQSAILCSLKNSLYRAQHFLIQKLKFIVKGFSFIDAMKFYSCSKLEC